MTIESWQKLLLAGRIGGVLIAVLAVCGSVAARERLALRHVTLDLPGPPSKVVPADLDGDGRIDLVVVVAYTEVEEIGEDRMEGLVQMTTVIPAAFDRREIHGYLATAEGGYTSAGVPLEMPPSILHLEPGPAAVGLIALTDDGLSRLRYSATDAGSPLSFANEAIEKIAWSVAIAPIIRKRLAPFCTAS